MPVNGCDCSIVIKTAYRETDIPYSEETLREAFSLLQEESSIEGSGNNRAIRKTSGVTGCIVSPLTIGTAPLLLCLAMGSAGLPVFVSETRNVYQYRLSLLPMEDSDCFDLVQDRRGERRLFEACRVKGFELRVMRDETLKLKLDICGERSPAVYPYTDIFKHERGERFNGDNVAYKINEKEYKNIYGVTLASKKEGGTKTELWIKRVLQPGADIPEIIEEMTITAQLLRDVYEFRRYGAFRITIKRLVLTSDETAIDTDGAVVGPLRYYVAGTVTTEVFTSTGEFIA
jgi:hypothetical protein